MDKQMIQLIDSAQTVATLATMIAAKAIEKDEAAEIAARYMDDAQKELWKCRQALREIIRLQDL